MAKLYGWLQSDKSKEISRTGTNWIEATLQSNELSVVVQLGDDNQVVLSMYKMHGRNNRGKLLKEIIFDNEGRSKIIYEKGGE